MALRSRANEILELIHSLGSRSPARVDRARTRLALLGPRAVDPLIEALEGAENRVRAHVMPLLSLIQDARAREPLAAMLLDRSPKLREMAIHSLSRFPCVATVHALNTALRMEKRVALRAATVASLVELYLAGEETAIRIPLQLLTDTDQPDEVRGPALRMLGELPRSQRDGLIERLRTDPSPQMRQAVENLDPTSHSADVGVDSSPDAGLRDDIERLAEEDFATWNNTVRLLVARGGVVVGPLVEEMRRRSHDPEFCNRVGIVFKALGPRRGRAVPAALDRLTEPLPLQIIIDVLGAWGVKSMLYRLKDLIERIANGPQVADSFCGVAPMNRVRAKAHLELARIGSRVVVRDLRDALHDANHRLELEVPAALEWIGKREEIGLLLHAYGREDAMVRERIRSAVLAIMKRERIRRNNRMFLGLDRAQKRALAAILPPQPYSGSSRKRPPNPARASSV